MKAKEKIKSYSLDEVKDKFIGKRGEKKRDKYEFDLQLDIIGEVIKSARLKRKLTQEMLGEKVGVQKAQISKLENGSSNITIETINRIFSALGTRISFNVQF
jgi:HTH-type transcriptional regulator / antitoxin HipB